jgi:dihydrodipicolinate synthase/N-acetylneuraminate lyase
MNRQELRELIRGLVVVAVTPFDDDFELDLGAMARDTEFWIESGLVQGKAVLKVASVMGEITSMKEAEWPQVLKTVVQTAKGRIPVISSVHGKDTRRTIEDAKLAQDLGAVGLQIVPPFENLPTQDDIVRYYRAISDAIDIGVMIYHAHWMPHARIEIETFKRMADLEHVMAIKWNSPDDVPYESMRELVADFNVFDNSNQPGRCYRNGGQGFLDHLAPAYPQHELEILDLLEKGRFDEGQELWDKVALPTNEFITTVLADSGGAARLKKATMSIMGHPVGSMRPPSQPLNEEEMHRLRQLLTGIGWPVPAAA